MSILLSLQEWGNERRAGLDKYTELGRPKKGLQSCVYTRLVMAHKTTYVMNVPCTPNILTASAVHTTPYMGHIHNTQNTHAHGICTVCRYKTCNVQAT